MKLNITYDAVDHELLSNKVLETGVDLIDTDSTVGHPDLAVSLRSRAGSVSSAGVVIKHKRTCTIKYPTVDPETGVTTQNLCRIEFEIHPDMESAEFELLKAAAATALAATATNSLKLFFAHGNTDTYVAV
jgi:hypothetical protein